jgi:hypothetical protein
VLPWVTGQAIEHLGAQIMPKLVFASLTINALIFVIMLLQRQKHLQIAGAGDGIY